MYFQFMIFYSNSSNIDGSWLIVKAHGSIVKAHGSWLKAPGSWLMAEKGIGLGDPDLGHPHPYEP